MGRGEGRLWLSWSPERRQGFTYGYLWSYHQAYTQACIVADELNPGNGFDLHVQHCFDRELSYPQKLDYYETKITTYYKQHPTDLDLPIDWLFLAFSDSENKSAEEIHSAWERGANP
jgi:hypothetical protein